MSQNEIVLYHHMIAADEAAVQTWQSSLTALPETLIFLPVLQDLL